MTSPRDIAIFQVGLHSDALLPDGSVLTRVHPATQCAGTTCWIHTPTEHAMRDWPINLRTDRGFLFVERICQHGIGHPDPDQVEFLRARFGAEGASAHLAHGCCGVCCREALFPDGAP